MTSPSLAERLYAQEVRLWDRAPSPSGVSRSAPFDLLAVLRTDARGLSDVNLARFLLASGVLAGRLRWHPGADVWERSVGGSDWRRIDGRQAEWTLADLADAACAAVKVGPGDAPRLAETLNAFQSSRRLRSVLRVLSGVDEVRVPDAAASTGSAAETFLASLDAGGWTLRGALHAAYTETTTDPLARPAFYRLAREVLGRDVKRRGEWGWPVTLPNS
ncbi:hypothetical protein [Nitriliruptor alkaliphilus]|uniref:hypothetical protein n=1 Tax=Nitriliruptor alkaliphilus TaxID=427918 RepID=UPI00069726D8|nr:hypothetical protein [Nitriliruptor alkaliphilus]